MYKFTANLYVSDNYCPKCERAIKLCKESEFLSEYSDFQICNTKESSYAELLKETNKSVPMLLVDNCFYNYEGILTLLR